MHEIPFKLFNLSYTETTIRQSYGVCVWHLHAILSRGAQSYANGAHPPSCCTKRLIFSNLT